MVSGFKKKTKAKKKEKMIFAKSKKEAITAFAVLAVFFGNTIYMIINYFIDEYKSAHPAPVAQAPPADKGAVQQQTIAQDANNIYQQTVGLENKNGQNPQENTNVPPSSSTGGDIEIYARNSARNNYGKMVTIVVGDSERTDPFMPDSEIIHLAKISSSSHTHLPSSLPFLSVPPETLPMDSEASKVMTTTISGILYDKYSPSAIINIEGSDYLVKRGDIINNYKILLIDKSQVIVQLGRNIYTAGVGELLSPTDLNNNVIANLNKKFGGNTISVNVKKKTKK